MILPSLSLDAALALIEPSAASVARNAETISHQMGDGRVDTFLLASIAVSLKRIADKVDPAPKTGTVEGAEPA